MLTIRLMIEKDAEIIAAAFQKQGWSKTKEQYEHYYRDQQKGERVVLVGAWSNEFAGYMTIEKHSSYQHFNQNNIPEMTDLNVLKIYQNKGIATDMIVKAEEIIKTLSEVAGIRVGLLRDYGPAQKLYGKLGYIPDGLGVSRDNHHYSYFEETAFDDDLVMGLTKRLL